MWWRKSSSFLASPCFLPSTPPKCTLRRFSCRSTMECSMSFGTPCERVIPVLCSRAFWPMLGWRPDNGLDYTPLQSTSEITTPWVLGGQPVRFLLISPREVSDWTAEMRFAAYFVGKYGL